jgi:restriction system protein
MHESFRIWMVRSGQASYLIDDFLQGAYVAIGWNELGLLDRNMTIHDLKTRFKEAYPDDSDGRVRQCVGQVWRFLQEFTIGDKVVTYDAGTREYYLGTITSDYKYDEAIEYHHCRTVDWLEEGISRDILSTEAKNTLGAISTIFELSGSIWKELNSAYTGDLSESDIQDLEEAVKVLEEQELRRLKDDVIYRSQEFIKDIIANLSWQDTELLVAGLLKAMGYKTRMTSKGGGDLGSDIIASPDELFLEQPLIRVEVKKRFKDKIGAPDIRNFIGGMRGHHKGIYVTTSSFSKEAQYEAERANFAITLIDSDWLVELLLSNYESLDPEIKAIVPLRKIYWPV